MVVSRHKKIYKELLSVFGMLRSKRGQQFGLNTLFLILIIAIIAVIGIFTLINSNEGAPLGDALGGAFTDAGNLMVRIAEPAANILLGLDKVSDANIKFLMIMTFILALIVIVAALDTASIFGEQRQGHLLNVIVGAIITIIGIRFMPKDLWSSLTAPSSAFVAVLLLALPFAAIFALTMKWNAQWARKLVWLLYIVFVGFIIADVARSPYLWAYLTFLVLAVAMLLFDGTVRSFLRMEKEKARLEGAVDEVKLQERIKIKQQIKELIRLKRDADSTESTELDKQINALRSKIRTDLV